MRRHLTTIALTTGLLLSLTGVASAGWNEGVAAFQAGRWSEAIREIEPVVREREEAGQKWAGGHFVLGQAYLKANRTGEAVEELNKAYKLDQGNVGIQLRLGEAYAAQGKYSSAISFLGRINPSSLPKEMQAFLGQLLGMAYLKTGDTGRAQGQLAAAASASRGTKGEASIQFQLGTTAYNNGDTQAAVNALARASSLDPGDASKQDAYAKALIRSGRETKSSAGKKEAYRKAATAAARVVQADPSYDNSMRMGEAQLGAEMFDEALSTFQSAAGKNTNDWLPHFYIGQAHTAKQQYRSAEQSLETSLDKAGPNDKNKVWSQLAFVYEKQKKYRDAERAYTRAGNASAAARAKDNAEIAEFNKGVEEENKRIQEMAEEEAAIKKALEELQGGKPPRP